MQRACCAAVLAASLLGASCKARVPEPARQAAPTQPQILRSIPTAPGGYLTDTSGTSDAEHRAFSVPHPIDTVAAFYRDRLKALGWLLMSDRADRPAGRLDLLARKDSQSLWVQLERNGEQAALVSLIAHGPQSPPRGPAGAGSGRRP